MRSILLLGVLFMVNGALGFEKETSLSQWRIDMEERLKTNWLTVVGLDWLKEGESKIGSAQGQKVKLPAPAPAELGVLRVKGTKAEIQFTSTENVKIQGHGVKAGQVYELSTDKQEKPTIVDLGSVRFFIIERPNGLGVRIKDDNSQTLKEFKGLQWWEAKKELIVEGEWKDFKEARKIRIPDLQGNTNEEMIKGSVHFQIDGKKFELFPTREGDELFFVFKDLTSGKESYGTGRFLKATVGKDNKVVLDFNKAYNPPCAQINYATCPLPPKENKLAIAIPAGEKSPLKKH